MCVKTVRTIQVQVLGTRRYLNMCEWHGNVLVKDPDSYQPDTIDLNVDTEAAKYWFVCFRDMIDKFAKQALESQCPNDETAEQRANQFRESYIRQLKEFEAQSQVLNKQKRILSIREILELNSKEMCKFGFGDPWLHQKHTENEAAMCLMDKRLQELDGIVNENERWLELVRGVLAGNMFDWGAQAVTSILQKNASFGFHAALDHIQKRPWLMDDLDAWLMRMHDIDLYKCAAIFVDNSGVDVVLGILPFARELLKRGTKVLLCANSQPALNDITALELTPVIGSCTCPILKKAYVDKRLLVYGNGQQGPCLDMRTLPPELCDAFVTHETDFLVIEGMGRALHTNLYARFNCDTLKLAVVKNKWLAQRLGGDTFSVICKYEPFTS